MSGRGRRMDVCITHTVAYLLRCPRSSMPEVMRACKFSLNESESRSRQMTIRHSFAKKPPPQCYIDTATVRGGPSTQATTTPPRTPPRTPTTPTTLTTHGGTRTTHPRPKQRLIRTSAGGMQKFRNNDLSFNRSSRSGECGLSNHGMCLRFPIVHIEKKHKLKNETEVVMYRPLYMIVEN